MHKGREYYFKISDVLQKKFVACSNFTHDNQKLYKAKVSYFVFDVKANYFQIEYFPLFRNFID